MVPFRVTFLVVCSYCNQYHATYSAVVIIVSLVLLILCNSVAKICQIDLEPIEVLVYSFTNEKEH